MTTHAHPIVRLKRKMTNVSSMLIMLQRTIDSPDASVYAREMSSVLDAAIEQVSQCEELTAHLTDEDSNN